MSFAERKTILQQLEAKRHSKILTYFLSDREAKGGPPPPGLSANIRQDSKVYIYEALKTIGHQERIDLLLYTRGGDTNAVWPIVSIIREFCKEFTVLVPFRSHSGGTMICLGADKIIMGRMGELSPIDPTTGNPFNPPDELVPGKRKGISVEDLTSYLALAKEKFDIKDKDVLEVFKELTKNVHPLSLGNVNRVHTQIRLLARNLLSLHIDFKKEEQRIDKITDTLTEKFYSHLYFISRKEAKQILGEDILVFPDDELEQLMDALLQSYADALQLKHDFCYNEVLGGNNQVQTHLFSAIIENEKVSFIYDTHLALHQRSELPPNIQVQLQPGQIFPPIIQGLPKNYHIEILAEHWRPNEGGV
jgi:hypothetical protein